MTRFLAIALCLCGLLFAGLAYRATAGETPDAAAWDPSMRLGPLPIAAVAPAALASSSAWSPPSWIWVALFFIVLGLLASLIPWLIAQMQASAFLKRHAMAEAVLERIAQAALVVVKQLQQTKPAAGVSGPVLLATAIDSVKDQLTGENGAAVAAKIIGVPLSGLDSIITSHVEAAVLQVKSSQGRPPGGELGLPSILTNTGVISSGASPPLSSSLAALGSFALPEPAAK